jgi:hypothetical protein
VRAGSPSVISAPRQIWGVLWSPSVCLFLLRSCISLRHPRALPCSWTGGQRLAHCGSGGAGGDCGVFERLCPSPLPPLSEGCSCWYSGHICCFSPVPPSRPPSPCPCVSACRLPVPLPGPVGVPLYCLCALRAGGGEERRGEERRGEKRQTTHREQGGRRTRRQDRFPCVCRGRGLAAVPVTDAAQRNAKNSKKREFAKRGPMPCKNQQHLTK